MTSIKGNLLLPIVHIATQVSVCMYVWMDGQKRTNKNSLSVSYRCTIKFRVIKNDLSAFRSIICIYFK